MTVTTVALRCLKARETIVSEDHSTKEETQCAGLSLKPKFPRSWRPEGGDILAFWARYLKKRNRSRTNVIAVIQARPTLQKGLSGKAAIILAERGQSQPEAVVA
jgi:hypothetical protein